MQWFKIALLLALTAAAPSGNTRQQEELMDRIQRAVILPRGAKPIKFYGQNYAFVGNTQVKAVYFIPEPLFTEKSGCVHGDGKPCPPDEIGRMVRENAKRRAGYASAGGRRWFANERDLPSIMDGGCFQITIRYDIPTRRVLGASCNGRG
jgi:hypothetical protein